MKPARQPFIRTIRQARDFVREVQICTIFGGKCKDIPALWDYVDLPEKSPGEGGWGEKVSAVWGWKNALPAKYPTEIFYGKITGAHAVLMTLKHLKTIRYPIQHRPVQECSPLARMLFEIVRTETPTTGELRRLAMESTDATKSQFDRAHKELQITFNIVRSNDPAVTVDTWVRFEELYPEICGEGEGD